LILIGIDPGKDGAFAKIGIGEPVCMTMPEDIYEVNEFISKSKDENLDQIHVFIEKAQAYPKQGVSSSFNYGAGYGTLCGILIANKIAFTAVPANRWARRMHIGASKSTSKEKSLEVVRKIFPNVNLLATKRSRKPHEGIIDALLIAEYGRRLLNGEQV